MIRPIIRFIHSIFRLRVFLLLSFGSLSVAVEERPNFLIIVIDDLNDYVGVLDGHPNAYTPNLDRIAGQGIVFTAAYCNSPVCNSSRASIWTGLRPTTTGIVSNRSGWFRDRPGFEHISTLPETMGRADYDTMAYGKVFHMGHGNKPANEWHLFLRYNYGPLQDPKLNYNYGDRLTDWGVLSEDNEYAASHDPRIADHLIEALEDTHEKPFFLAGGFIRPHTPLYATQQWFDKHPKEHIELPDIIADDNKDLVYFGKYPRADKDIEAPGLFNQEYAEENDKWKDLLQAYLASTSAMDYQLGRVYDAYLKSEYRDNTYLIIFSDHGWHLGEKRHWGKAALWEQTTRIPLIILGPDMPAGIRYNHPVDLLSIYPTVIDYAGLNAPHTIEGHSLRPVLENPDTEWIHPVITTFSDHHALRTQHWRYIRYVNGSEELYDHRDDPHEFENLVVTNASSEQIQKVLITHRDKLLEALNILK